MMDDDGHESPDDTDGAPPPGFCPLCKADLVTKWTVTVQRRVARRFAVPFPVHLCERCDVAVRVCTLPRKTLFATKKAALHSVAADVDD